MDRESDSLAPRRVVGFTGMQLDSTTASLTHPKDKSMSLSSYEPTETHRATVAKILGLATAVPEYSIAQSDAALVAQQLNLSERWNNALPALYRKSGVKHRGSVLLSPDRHDGLARQSFYQPASATHPCIESVQARSRGSRHDSVLRPSRRKDCPWRPLEN